MHVYISIPSLVIAWSKAWVCRRLRVGIAGSNPARSVFVSLSLVNAACFQVEVPATGKYLVYRRPWATRACRAMGFYLTV